MGALTLREAGGGVRPAVLVRTTANRQVVVEACAAARGLGVGAGMMLAQARAMCPAVVYAEHDPAGDARALEALARWMMKHVGPWVQMVQRSAECRWAGLLVDVGGTQRLFGSMEKVRERMARALEKMGIAARVAIGPNVGAAWAMTFESSGGGAAEPVATVLDPLRGSEGGLGRGSLALGVHGRDARATCGGAEEVGRELGGTAGRAGTSPAANLVDGGDGVRPVAGCLSDLLAPLPVVALRVEERTLEGLHHLGIERIGQLMRLPREQIPARFGDLLLRRLDQALGRVPEPLEPLPHSVPIEAGVDFDGIVDGLEALWEALRGLIERIVQQLIRRDAGARRIVVRFVRPEVEAIEKTIELSRPSRRPGDLFNLIRCVMETIGVATPARGKARAARFRVNAEPSLERRIDRTGFIPEGFVGLSIRVVVYERIFPEQVQLLEHEECAGREELDRLVERLRIRLGEGAIAGAEAVESHVPEKAFCVVDWRESPHPGPLPGSPGVSARTGLFSRPGEGDGGGTGVLMAYRPLQLLPVPVEIAVMVRPSHDLDGAPVAFIFEGHQHRIVHAMGPERIAGAWWIGHDKTRDYFHVEDSSGRKWWIFRVIETRKWYWHGGDLA